MKKSLSLLLWGVIMLPQLMGQNLDSRYFPQSEEESEIWESYLDFLNGSTLTNIVKADSLLDFAHDEYAKGQYSKTRALCELALSLNPDLGEAHNLIGKAYISSSKLCNQEDGNVHRIKEEIIWAAMDEWELATSKTNSFRDEALLLMEKYSRYLPSREFFKSCYSNETLKEGDDFFVGCWIQRKTKVRLNPK